MIKLLFWSMRFNAFDKLVLILILAIYVIPVLIILIMIIMIGKNIIVEVINNNSPRITIEVCIVEKLINNKSTVYYVTFESSTGGSRKEFRVPYKEYELLAEGDVGVLKYQGTRYISFERRM